MGGINKHHKPSPKNGTAWVRHTYTIVIADDKHTRKDLLACQNIIISFSIPFLPKNACKKNPCKNNATCQAGFTDRDYQCLCVDGSGFKGHDCDEGKESYTFISIGNDMISSVVWDKSARVNFSKANQIARARTPVVFCVFRTKCCASLTPRYSGRSL